MAKVAVPQLNISRGSLRVCVEGCFMAIVIQIQCIDLGNAGRVPDVGTGIEYVEAVFEVPYTCEDAILVMYFAHYS